jgi:hypothetical protein
MAVVISLLMSFSIMTTSDLKTEVEQIVQGPAIGLLDNVHIEKYVPEMSFWAL